MKVNDSKKNCECGEDCDCDGSCDCGVDHSHEHTPDHSHEHAHSHGQNFDEETQASIQEIQILEQNFEQLLQQKHLFNMEINETELSLRELEKAEGDVFKLVGGQVIIKSSKEKLSADLKHKKELLEVRMKAIERQEKEFSERIEEVRNKIMSKISPRE